MKILLAAGAALLVAAALLPLRALASTTGPETRTMALAIGQPLSRFVSGSFSRVAVAEPGLLIVVGSSLISLGSLVRRITSDDGPPPGE
jgi:hypothetical protein